MKNANVLTLITSALWLSLLVFGLAGIDGVRLQNVQGFPSEGQLRYYVHIPEAVLALVVTTWVAARRWPLLNALAIAIAVMALLGLPCYLVYFTGGV
jgi:hypothetical protein